MATWQFTLSATGRTSLFPSEASRHAAVRALVRTAAPHLTLFCVLDGAVHLVLHCDVAQAGRIARAVLLGMRSLCAAPIASGPRSPVADDEHLAWLLERMLGMPRREGIPVHPALWAGSCFVDLVGARALGSPPLALAGLLPGFLPAAAHRAVGLDPAPLVPFDDRQLLLAGPGRLLAASAAALAADPGYSGRAAPVVAARLAVAHLGAASGLPTRPLADALGLTTHGIRRLQRLPPEPEALQAVRLRLALEERIARQALAAPAWPAAWASPPP